MNSLFLNQSYGKLYEEIFKGKCEVFEFQSSLGIVKHLFMKRKTPHKIDGVIYYDLITPFTYGGPIIEACAEEDKWELLWEFQSAFQEYCLENNIVSEFIRFHPLLTNSMEFLHCYELDYIEDSRVINIARSTNPVTEEFSAESIVKVLDALKQGVVYQIYRGKEKMDEFSEFLNKVQKREDEQRRRYFEGCKEILDDQLVIIEALCDGEVIGMGLNILADNTLSTHTVVTDERGDSLNVAFVLAYELTKWSSSNNVELIHLAGDWINKSEKEISAFNNHFGGQTTYAFCVGRKVWNEEIYERLCERAKVERYIEYFPAYRVWEKKMVGWISEM